MEEHLHATPMVYHLLDEAEVFSESKGGAISRWAANVLRDGNETLVCPAYDSSWGFPESRLYVLPHWHRTRFPVHAVLYRLPWILQRAAYLRLFAPLLKKLKAGDLVYVHNRPECAASLAAAAKQLGVKVVLHMHNSHLTRSSGGQLAALKSVSLVLCSDFLRREIRTRFPEYFKQTYLVYNGADEGRFHAGTRRPGSVPMVIYTGRLVAYKGVHVLLAAMKLLEQRGVAVTCKIVGGAGFATKRRSSYMRKLEGLRASNTEFTGYRSGEALASLLREAAIFCAPSIWNDPFPLAPLEAMATGIPVVASNVGGIPEELVYGGGVLVPPSDPVALADALQELVQDEGKREAMGEAAKAAFRRHFLWSHAREQYQAAIHDVMADAAEAGG